MSTEGIFLLKWFEQFWFYYCSWVQFKVKIGTIVSCTPGLISSWAQENKSLFIFPLGMTPFVVNKEFFLFTVPSHTFHQAILSSFAPKFFTQFSLHQPPQAQLQPGHLCPDSTATPERDFTGYSKLEGTTGISESSPSVHHPFTAQIHDLGDISTMLSPAELLNFQSATSKFTRNSPIQMPDTKYPLVIVPLFILERFSDVKEILFLTSP